MLVPSIAGYIVFVIALLSSAALSHPQPDASGRPPVYISAAPTGLLAGGFGLYLLAVSPVATIRFGKTNGALNRYGAPR